MGPEASQTGQEEEEEVKMDRWMEGRMDGCMDAWMPECMDVCTYVHTFRFVFIYAGTCMYMCQYGLSFSLLLSGSIYLSAFPVFQNFCLTFNGYVHDKPRSHPTHVALQISKRMISCNHRQLKRIDLSAPLRQN